ncbi:MAG TPA: ribonuclease III [Woeseiaceae bacterium]|nr:ribonuclease III [Woeseiaceae bacterium]
MDKAAAWLKHKLDYEFRDEQLLTQALTHRSSLGPNNERLEYLGDAVLDVVVSEATYKLRPEASEGVLSRIRSSLVKDTMLTELATELDLASHLILGAGVKKGSGYGRSSILGDALEAIFGAIYLDSGFDEARRVIRRVYGDRLVELPESASRRDPKTQLQELLQARKLDLPQYRVENVSGQAHRQTFEVSCSIDALEASTIGRGSSRRRAEQDAAMKMLALVGESA